MGRMHLTTLVQHPAILRLAPYSILPIALSLLAIFALVTMPRIDPAEQRLMAGAFALDFVLAVPVLVYFTLIRTKRLPLLALAPTIAISYLVAYLVLPREHHEPLVWIRHALAPLEIALIVYLAILARRILSQPGADDDDFSTRFRKASCAALGARVPADVLTTEVSIFRYAFGPRFRDTTNNTFTIHREANYRTLLIGLGIAVVVETVGVHFLVARLWSEIAAWIFTALSVYSLLWLVGDYRAMCARPMRITRNALRLRIGVRWEADIPLARISHVERTRVIDDPTDRSALIAKLCGATNVRIEFTGPVEVLGPYGILRRVTRAYLQIDDASAFCERLIAALPDRP